MIERALGLLRDVDLAFPEPLDQLVGRQVDNFDIVGLVEHGIRHRFADPYARDLSHDIVQALDVLNVERGVHIDAGGKQLLDVEITLGMAAAWSIGVGEFVHKRDLRAALEEGIQVHLLERMAVIVDFGARNDLETVQQGLSFHPAVGFYNANNDIGAFYQLGPCRKQHFIGLAYAGSGAEKHLQTAAALILALRLDE